jgi:hypothetical protein
MLTSITLPANIETINSLAFDYCYNIVYVTVLRSSPKYSSITAITDNNIFDTGSLKAIYVNRNNVTTYKTAEWWSKYAPYIMDLQTPQDYYFTYTISGSSVTVTGLTQEGINWLENCDGALEIPGTIASKTVTAIADNAFKGKTVTTSFTIPSGVTRIGANAFSGLTKVTTITIPAGVTSIGNNAFDGCSKVSTLTYNATYIESVGGAYDNPFYKTGAGVSNVTLNIGSNVRRIPGSFLYTYTSNDYPNYHYLKIISVTIPSSVESIGDSAFSNITSVTSLSIGTGVKSIGDHAFAQTSISTINIPNNVTSIGSLAFAVCPNVTSVTIGTGVTSIGDNAFTQCPKVSVLNYSATDVEEVGGSRYNPFRDMGTGIEELTLNIGSNVRRIPDNFLLTDHPDYGGIYTPNITSVTIPNNVTSIGNNAFEYCRSIKNLVIGTKVSTIMYMAFGECTGLTSITIPNSVISIGAYAFYKCSGATSLTIGTGVASIGTLAFYGCTTVSTINYYAKSITSVGSVSNNPFYGLGTGVTGVTLNIGGEVNVIPANFLYIDSATNTPKITAITIPNSVTGIGAYAFYKCSSATSLNIIVSSAAATIGNYAFYQCSGLTSITIPNNFISIGASAFTDAQT